MIRNLKALGMTLVALFAMSAMMASAVSAHTPAVFHVEEVPALITATQKEEHKFTVTGQTVTCVTAVFHGTATELTPTSILLEATYANCKAEPLGNTATVTGFGKIGEAGKCWYEVNASGAAALKCNGGDVTVDAGPCVVHVPAQPFASGVTYSTEVIKTSGKHDLTVGFNIENIEASHTDGFLCPFGSSGTVKGAKLEGASTATAKSDPGGVDLDLTHTPTVP